MVRRLFGAGWGLRAGRFLAAAVVLCGSPWAGAQSGAANVPDAPDASRGARPRALPDRLPDKPSQPPAFTIPVEPLGFSAPGPIYLGQRASIVSLDFLDENRLLFTFRVPGLIRRAGGDSDTGEERQIRAVVLTLPAGTVEAEALWTVHDRARYLWMLKDGHFLLRDRENLQVGDATLELKPFLRFPGPLLWLEMDPAQQFLVTASREKAGAAEKPGEVPSPPTAAASISVDGQKADGAPPLVVRILRRDSGQVMLFSRVRTTVHLPINSDGYLESIRARGAAWLVNLKYFSGGSRILGQVESACSPAFDFISQRELLMTGCLPSGADKLVALTTDGRRLWEDRAAETSVWPLVVMSPDGERLAREALAVTHPVNAYSPLAQEDIKGQLVEVLDAADGKMALVTSASPPLDGGGNVSISPAGRRVAVRSAGAIQVFELPMAPPGQSALQPANQPTNQQAR